MIALSDRGRHRDLATRRRWPFVPFPVPSWGTGSARRPLPPGCARAVWTAVVGDGSRRRRAGKIVPVTGFHVDRNWLETVKQHDPEVWHSMPDGVQRVDAYVFWRGVMTQCM